MHPVWLIALAVVGLALTYLAVDIFRGGGDLPASGVFAGTGLVLLTAVALDAVGVIA